MRYVRISQEHWEALCDLVFAVRQGNLVNLTDALDYLHEVNSYPPEGVAPSNHFGLSTMITCGNILKIAREIERVLGEEQ